MLKLYNTIKFKRNSNKWHVIKKQINKINEPKIMLAMFVNK